MDINTLKEKIIGKPLTETKDRGKLLTIMIVLGFVDGFLAIFEYISGFFTNHPTFDSAPDFYYGFARSIIVFALYIGIWRWSKIAVKIFALIIVIFGIIVPSIILWYGQSINGIQFYTPLMISLITYLSLNLLLFWSVYRKWHLFH